MLQMTTSNLNRYLVVWTCVWVVTPISTSITSRTLLKCSLRRDAVIHTDTDDPKKIIAFQGPFAED